jgi:anti-anti-sigma factor
LDSTGAAVLARWRKRLRAQGKRLVLLDPSPEVRSTLELMRWTGHFQIAAQSAESQAHAEASETGASVIPPFPGGHTLAWQGEVTAANARAVWHLTLRHLASAGPPPRQTFIIDLSRLRFIDSAGAKLMGRLRAWARRRKRDLRFLGLQPDVRTVLRLAKLGDLAEPARR